MKRIILASLMVVMVGCSDRTETIFDNQKEDLSGIITKQENDKNQFNRASSEEDINYLSLEEFGLILTELDNIKESSLPEDIKQRQIETVLKPFNEIGKQVMYYTLNVHDITDPYFELEAHELEAIQGLSNQNLTEIGIFLNIDNIAQVNGYDREQAIHCLGVASGITGIAHIIANTGSLAAFGEAVTAKQFLKLTTKLATRFVGWIGVALFVNDFANCMGIW